MNRASLVAMLKLGTYYAALVALFLGLQRAVPAVRDALSMARLQSIEGLGGASSAPVATPLTSAGMAFLTTLATLGALALAVPVAWAYRVTKPRADLDLSVLQTVIVLPVAVAGIVLIVQNSLALAFSLAGIVAAVRFRNTLQDTKDAVYIFVTIGLGLAAGVQALAAGFVMSFVFVLVVLGLWRMDLAGADPASEGSRVAGMLLVDVASGPAVRSAVEDALAAHAKRWRLVRATPTPGDRATLAYFVRLRRKTDPPALVDAVRRAGPDVASADFESLDFESVEE